MPQSPGQPSAAPYPSSELMKSIVRSAMSGSSGKGEAAASSIEQIAVDAETHRFRLKPSKSRVLAL